MYAIPNSVCSRRAVCIDFCFLFLPVLSWTGSKDIYLWLVLIVSLTDLMRVFSVSDHCSSAGELFIFSNLEDTFSSTISSF